MNRADRADVDATMREGVTALCLIENLQEAICRLSGCSLRDLGSRDGVASALSSIRSQFPAPCDTRVRLQISSATPPEAKDVFDCARAEMDRDPTAGFLRYHFGSNFLVFEVSGEEGVPREAREAWRVVEIVAAVCGVSPRKIESEYHLARLAVRALSRLRGERRSAVMRIAACARARASDPRAAAIAYAHAPSVRGSIAVVVESTTEGSVWRSSGTTRIRPVNPLPWHPEPAVCAVLGALAMATIQRKALRHVCASSQRTWKQAALADHERGFEAYIQRCDGRIDHVYVLGQGAWWTLGEEVATDIAASEGVPARGIGENSWPAFKDEACQLGGSGSLEDSGVEKQAVDELLNAGVLTPGAYERFQIRVQVAVRRSTDRAVLCFEAGLPEETARLARLIEPIRSRDPASHKQSRLGRPQLDASVIAAMHRDPAAMARAVVNQGTRSLVLAARHYGPWRIASEALASGRSAWEALHAYAEATVGCALSQAAVRSLSTWPTPPWQGLGDSSIATRFCDLGRLAAVLWDATPSRPPMLSAQLDQLADGLAAFDFVSPSRAGPGDRTWDDPVAATAYAEALRHRRTDVVGASVLGPGVIDMVRWVDAKLSSIGLAREPGEAVRRAILVPPGRLASGLERMSDSWHRSIDAMARERTALVEELITEMEREFQPNADLILPEDYPTPLPAALVYDGVTIRPLRGPQAFEHEASEMANCLMSYRERARVGDLLVFALLSVHGRSTLGLVIHGDERSWEIDVFQHTGPQHVRTDEPPPDGHAAAAVWFVTSLDRQDGGPGGENWRSRLWEVRAAHAKHAIIRPSEQSLSQGRRERLVALDLAQLGLLLGRHQRKLTVEEFRRWASDLATAAARRVMVRTSP